MNKKDTLKKTNIITLDRYRPIKEKPPTTKEVEEIQDQEVITAFHDACIKISEKVDIKGYALVAWDKKGTPCISYYADHPENPISDMMIPSFTQTCFQGIVSQRLSKPEDLDGEE